MTVREAASADVERIVELADAARREYAAFAPTFYRPAAGAVEVHRPWLAGLVDDPGVGTFVHEDDGGAVDGFVTVTTGPAPPVYDPGGPTALVDDFTVASADLWGTAGAALLSVAHGWATEQGAVQLVVVAGAHDDAKRALLRGAGLSVASEWFTTPLGG